MSLFPSASAREQRWWVPLSASVWWGALMKALSLSCSSKTGLLVGSHVQQTDRKSKSTRTVLQVFKNGQLVVRPEEVQLSSSSQVAVAPVARGYTVFIADQRARVITQLQLLELDAGTFAFHLGRRYDMVPSNTDLFVWNNSDPSIKRRKRALSEDEFVSEIGEGDVLRESMVWPAVDGKTRGGYFRAKVQKAKDIHTVAFVAETKLPTLHGTFRVRVYNEKFANGTNREITVIVSGDVTQAKALPVRVHDQCFTSEVLGSLKCDCQLQLHWTMKYIMETNGVIVYMPQEGRGIGLGNKIKAYSLQEHGFDTVDANRALGLSDDCRTYDCVPKILMELQVQSIQLITNNPRKVRLLTDLGVQMAGRIPIIMQTNEHSDGYLKAKSSRMDHHI